MLGDDLNFHDLLEVMAVGVVLRREEIVSVFIVAVVSFKIDFFWGSLNFIFL